jgi:hypothetical protein
MNKTDTHPSAVSAKLDTGAVRRVRGGAVIRTNVRAGSIMEKYDATAKGIIQSMR